MLSPDDIRLQRALVEQVITIKPHPLARDALMGLDPRYASRIAVYHESFLGRAVSSLAEVVLAPACEEYGPELIKELVARYFARVPPAALSIVHALDGLEDFIREHAEGESACLLADAIAVSLARWHLLHGMDPPAQPGPGYLSGPAVFLAGVLLIKVDVDTIATFQVPQTLQALAQRLAQGDSIDQAIHNLSNEEIEACDDDELGEFLRRLF